MDRTSWIRLSFMCVIAFGGLLLAPHPLVSSAHSQLDGGVLTVNTIADTLANDLKLSLREALGVANGSITERFDLGEQQQMAGCTFNAFGDITGGCGAGFVDNIVFAASLGFSPIITLWQNSSLPSISDTAATNILGHINNVYPIINASQSGLNKDGLIVTSDNNTIYGLTIISATRDGFHITGNNNIIGLGSSVRASTRHGISIEGGDHNMVRDSTIRNNNMDGVAVSASAQYNSIENSSIYSNTLHGVEFHGVDTSNNVITRTAIFQNGINGIAEAGSATHNDWREMSIYSNGGLGINRGSEDALTERPDPPTNFRITSVNQSTGDVSGQADGSSGEITITVDLYRLALDPSGYGEGQQYVGSTVTDVNGNWTINDPSPSSSNGCYTAVVRGLILTIPYASEFTRSNCSLFAPSISR